MKFRNLDRDSWLPETGFLRLRDVLKLIPVSPSSWWTGVRQGKFPKPLKLGPHTTVWRAEDIRALIDRMGRAA
jgi:predicted DNA-binding transcriptional regulator AlpA